MPDAPITVVAAAVIRDGKLLLAERAHPPELAGKWELPGGKVDEGESHRAALRRECSEELGVEVRVGDRVGPSVPTVDGQGVLRVYLATLQPADEPQALDHRSLRWVDASELDGIDILAADRPVLEILRRNLNVDDNHRT